MFLSPVNVVAKGTAQDPEWSEFPMTLVVLVGDHCDSIAIVAWTVQASSWRPWLLRGWLHQTRARLEGIKVGEMLEK